MPGQSKLLQMRTPKLKMPSPFSLIASSPIFLKGHQYLGTEEKSGEDADRIESLHDVGNRPDAKRKSGRSQFLYKLISLSSFCLIISK